MAVGSGGDELGAAAAQMLASRKTPRTRRAGNDAQQRTGHRIGATVARALGPGMFSSPVVTPMDEPFGRQLVRGHHTRGKRSARRRGGYR